MRYLIAIIHSKLIMKLMTQLKYSLSGLSATFIGNGIGRFAYITLMPALIQNSWFSKGEAAQLGVAALIGYLAAPIVLQKIINKVNSSLIIRLSMLLCSISYLFSAFKDAGFLWFYILRLMAGFGGAILIILPASLVLTNITSLKKGKISGIIFSGIGLGAVLSGLLIPIMVRIDLIYAWIAMGGSCLLLTILTWKIWGTLTLPAPKMKANSSNIWHSRALLLLLFAYGLDAIGYLPHTLFWVDFLVRERGYSMAVGGASWAMFGLGAATGPMLLGMLSDRFGLKKTTVTVFFIKALAVMLPYFFFSNLMILNLSIFLVGLFTTGLVTLVSTYCLRIVGAADHREAWGAMTFTFALTQALTGFVMASLITKMDSYLPLFIFSSLALFTAVALVALMQEFSRSSS